MSESVMRARYGGAPALASAAARLNGAAPAPRLFLLTDPDRIADPIAAVRALPPGCGVIYRHFGKPDRQTEAERLAELCSGEGHIFLIAADPALASSVGAEGVHWPEWALGQARRTITQRFALNSAAAHSASAVMRAAKAEMDLAFVSPAFPSRSPSAGRAIGPLRLRALAKTAPLPLYALGGVCAQSARRLETSELSGLAAVEALAGAYPRSGTPTRP